MNLPDEPLLAAAPLARQLARELCHEEAATGQRCAWYHGLWLYLRALGLITTPVHHAQFLRAGLARVARDGRALRVLVSGAADFSTCAHVLAAGRDLGVQPAVTVLDICDTPLHLNRWYATRTGTSVATLRSDVLDYDGAGGFDVVCTHSFFGRFTVEQRPRLMSVWYAALRPGGIAIAVNRVRSGAGAGTTGFRHDQAEAFRANVVRKAEGMRALLDVEPAELGDMAVAYAARHRTHPVRSHEEMRGMFARAGFVIDHYEEIAVGKAVDNGVGGPTTLEGARYGCVVARRP